MEEPNIVFLDNLEIIQKIKNWDIWKKPGPLPPAPLPFRIQESPEKGLGMFAARPIKVGELIMLERPVIVTRTRLGVSQEQKLNTDIFHGAALSGLPSALRASIMSLNNCYGSKKGQINGTLLTNFLALEISDAPDPDSYVGLFLALSRVNHDCAPNSNFFFGAKSFTGQLYAVRNIAKDEEITMLYTHLAAPRTERHKDLREKYEFDCMCSTCSLPAALLKQSDTRRKALGDLEKQIQTASFPRGMSMTLLKDLLGWAKEERMFALNAQILLHGGLFAHTHGDHATAREWAQAGQIAVRLMEGQESKFA